MQLPCIGVAKFMSQVAITAAPEKQEACGARAPWLRDSASLLCGFSQHCAITQRLPTWRASRGGSSLGGQAGFVSRRSAAACAHQRGLTPRSRPSPNSRMPGRRSRACLSSSAPARHSSVGPGLPRTLGRAKPSPCRFAAVLSSQMPVPAFSTAEVRTSRSRGCGWRFAPRG